MLARGSAHVEADKHHVGHDNRNQCIFQKEVGPARTAILPSRGSSNPYEDQNMHKHSTATPARATRRDTVTWLLAELQKALVACDEGPLRAIVDSDGSWSVQMVAGRPVAGRPLVGVPIHMARIEDGAAEPVEFVRGVGSMNRSQLFLSAIRSDLFCGDRNGIEEAFRALVGWPGERSILVSTPEQRRKLLRQVCEALIEMEDSRIMPGETFTLILDEAEDMDGSTYADGARAVLRCPAFFDNLRREAL